MKKNIKISLFAFVILASIAVISSVSIALVLSSDKMKTTADALSRLRLLMTGTSTVKMDPLTAYIVPSDDAHQVSCIRNF
jgi:hypothetical protein